MEYGIYINFFLPLHLGHRPPPVSSLPCLLSLENKISSGHVDLTHPSFFVLLISINNIIDIIQFLVNHSLFEGWLISGHRERVTTQNPCQQTWNYQPLWVFSLTWYPAQNFRCFIGTPGLIHFSGIGDKTKFLPLIIPRKHVSRKLWRKLETKNIHSLWIGLSITT